MIKLLWLWMHRDDAQPALAMQLMMPIAARGRAPAFYRWMV
jgi:hypothetical protein